MGTKLIGLNDIDYIDGLEGSSVEPPKICQLLGPDKVVSLSLTNNRQNHCAWFMLPEGDKQILTNARFWTHCVGYNRSKPALVKRRSVYAIDLRETEGGYAILMGEDRLCLTHDGFIWSSETANSPHNTVVIEPLNRQMSIDPKLDPYDMSIFFNSSVLLSTPLNGRRYNINHMDNNVVASFDLDSQEYLKWVIETSSWTNGSNCIYEVKISNDNQWIKGVIGETIKLTTAEGGFYMIVLPYRQVILVSQDSQKIFVLAIRLSEQVNSCYLIETVITPEWLLPKMREYTPFIFNLDHTQE
jgi:hypothetical protein